MFRYRYDTETGLYYLQSRYYNPEWGRFINADGIAASKGELLSANMFAYCKNNPVNMSDENGDRPEFSGTGHDTGTDNSVSLAVMNNRYDYNTGTIRKPVIKRPGVSYDYKAVIRDAAITAVQNAKVLTVKLRYFNNIPIKASLADLGAFDRGFIGISIFTTYKSMQDNNSKYSRNEALLMDGIDMLCFAGGLAISLVAYGAKRLTDYEFNKKY